MGTEIASLFATIGADISQLEAGLGKAAGAMETTGKRLSSIGSTLTLAVSAPLAGIGVAAAKAAIDLDAQMRNIQSISKQSDESLAGLQQTFLDLSTDITKTTDSASNLAAGFYQIQSSGFAGDDAMTVLLASTKAATAGLTSTSVAATAVTAGLNAYGEGADKAAWFSDVMFRTVDRGVINFEELAGSLSNVVGSAAAAGVSFDVVGAAVATMTKQGLSGAEATVSLNQVLISLLKPSEELAGVLEEMGYASGQAALDSLGLAGTLNALTAAGYDTTGEMAGLFTNVRALRGVLALTGENAQTFADDMTAMADAAGASEAAFAIQTKSFQAQLESLRNAFQVLGIEMFNLVAPSFQAAVNVARDLVNQLRSLDPDTQKMIINFGLVAAAAGPVVLGIGKAIQVFGLLTSGAQAVVNSLNAIPALFTAVSTAWQAWQAGLSLTTSLQVAFGTMAVSIGAIALAVGSVIAVWYTWNEEITKTNAEGQKAVSGAWSKFFDDMTKKGADASQVADEYLAAQERVRAKIEETNPILQLFIEDQGELSAAYDELSAQLLDSAGSYDEYLGAAQRVATANNLEIDANGNLIREYTTRAGKMQELVQAGYVLSESQYMNMRALELMGDAANDAGVTVAGMAAATEAAQTATDGLTASTETLSDSLMSAADIMRIAESSFTTAGMAEAAMTTTLSALNVALGETTAQQQSLEAQVRLVADAFAAGVITEQQFTQYMLQAKEGTLALSAAQQATLEGATAYQQSLRDSALAAQEMALRQQDLAAALKDATQAQIAQAAITELKNAYDSGKISFEQYIGAVGSVQKEFGLIDEASVKMAEGILKATEALSKGQLPAQTFGATIKIMAEQAQTGVPQVEALLSQFATAPEQIESTQKAAEDVGGAFDDLAGDAEDLLSKVKDNLGGLETGFQNIATAAQSHTGAVSSDFTNMAGSMEKSLANAGKDIETFTKKIGELSDTNVSIGVSASGFDEAIKLVKDLTSALKGLGDAADSLPTSRTIELSFKKAAPSGTSAPLPPGTLAPSSAERAPISAPAANVSITHNIYDPLAGAMALEQTRQAIRARAGALM